MKEIALEFLKIINSKGYKAYIVGGFVRDYLMQIESHDIDINTKRKSLYLFLFNGLVIN